MTSSATVSRLQSESSGESSTSPSSHAWASLPCDACQKAKLKCNRGLPTCETCAKHERTCLYSERENGRLRRFHHRSRKGCQQCKTRRVRCDEGQPVCANCTRRNTDTLCIYPPDSPTTSPSSSLLLDTPRPAETDTAVPDSNVILFNRNKRPRNLSLTGIGGFKADTSVKPPSHPKLSFRTFQEQFQPIPPPDVPVTRSIPINEGTISLWSEHVDDIELDGTIDLPIYSSTQIHNSFMFLPQFRIIEQPDELVPYFPSVEQRHQFRHFFKETAQSLLVIPTAPLKNPWLMFLTHLALGKPNGHDICHDAFRQALLSVASLDIGIKMHYGLRSPEDNAMYAVSSAQRKEAMTRLKFCARAGLYKDATGELAEVGIATVIALALRDRLEGFQDWQEPLTIGGNIIADQGGPARFLSASTTSTRRFLVEQIACLEMIGVMNAWVAPQVLAWDNEWLLEDQPEESNDHLHVVYGWTRPIIQQIARTTIICYQSGQLDVLRKTQPTPVYRSMKELIDTRAARLKKISTKLLEEGMSLRCNILMTPLPAEVVVGSLCAEACTSLCHLIIILNEDFLSHRVQANVEGILELVDEGMSRGIFAGLLLPLTWAAGFATPERQQRVATLFKKLQLNYHLKQVLLDRLVQVNWTELSSVSLADWETFLREREYFVPIF